MFLYEKVIITINVEIKILTKKSIVELMLMNKKRILIPPTKAPKNILEILTFLFNIKETDNNKIKSKKKFNSIIRSTYIFI